MSWELWLPLIVAPAGSIIVGLIAARQSDRANSRTEGVAALSSGVNAWKDLAERADRERDETNARFNAVAERMDKLEAELHVTSLILDDSLELNSRFIRWVRGGAMPPPPEVQTKRLRERLQGLIEDRLEDNNDDK